MSFELQKVKAKVAAPAAQRVFGAYEYCGKVARTRFERGSRGFGFGILKRHGRFVVLADPVMTSGRNLRAHSFWSIARLLTPLALRGPDGFRDREGLGLWYRPLREKLTISEREET